MPETTTGRVTARTLSSPSWTFNARGVFARARPLIAIALVGCCSRAPQRVWRRRLLRRAAYRRPGSFDQLYERGPARQRVDPHAHRAIHRDDDVVAARASAGRTRDAGGRASVACRPALRRARVAGRAHRRQQDDDDVAVASGDGRRRRDEAGSEVFRRRDRPPICAGSSTSTIARPAEKPGTYRVLDGAETEADPRSARQAGAVGRSGVVSARRRCE